MADKCNYHETCMARVSEVETKVAVVENDIQYIKQAASEHKIQNEQQTRMLNEIASTISKVQGGYWTFGKLIGAAILVPGLVLTVSKLHAIVMP